ncbi:MAG: F0F1 ATP synthase subunit I [Granulosicoccaceae bacterium]
MDQAKKRLRVIKWMLLVQLLTTLLFAIVAWLVRGQVAGYSALLGGFICWLPSCYFAYRAFRYKGARAADKIVRSLYAGEVGKMFLTMALFTIVFVRVRPLDALALFAGFVIVQSVNWFVPFFTSRAEYKAGSKLGK